MANQDGPAGERTDTGTTCRGLPVGIPPEPAPRGSGRLTGRLASGGLFLAEAVRATGSTGAVLPSGGLLAAALTRHVRPPEADGPRAILEVGPGTGAVTRRIARRLGPSDTLDLVECNPRFVDRLRGLLRTDRDLAAVADRVRLWHCGAESFPLTTQYDAIVSGLPFTNFEPDLVNEILARLTAALAPEGRLSFFRYAGLHRIALLVARHPHYRRLLGVGSTLHDALDRYQVHRELVPGNLPPAWVHHLAPLAPAGRPCPA